MGYLDGEMIWYGLTMSDDLDAGSIGLILNGAVCHKLTYSGSNHPARFMFSIDFVVGRMRALHSELSVSSAFLLVFAAFAIYAVYGYWASSKSDQYVKIVEKDTGLYYQLEEC